MGLPEGIPPPAHALLDWWLPRVREVFGSRLESVVLFGSLTYGDYCPGWSDVDVCIVLPSRATKAEIEASHLVDEQMTAAFQDDCGPTREFGQLLESICVTRQVAADPVHSSSNGTGVALKPFDRYMLSDRGVCFEGIVCDFAQPAEVDLARDTMAAVADLRDPGALDRSPIWQAGTLHWIARSIVFWRDGKLVSKTAALEHEIDSGSPFSEAFQVALSVRRSGSAAAINYHDRLRTAFKEAVQDAADAIERLVNSSLGTTCGQALLRTSGSLHQETPCQRNK